MKRIATAVAFFFCLVAFSQSAFATTYYYWAEEGEELAFNLYPNDTAYVFFEPWDTGNWTFNAWHSNMLSYNKCASVEYYWTYLDDPSEPYHKWNTDAAGYLWPLRATENLYSGSPEVGYYMKIKPLPNNNYVLPMHVLILFAGD